jgi:protein SCO1/2
MVLGGCGLVYETPVRGQSAGVSQTRPQPPGAEKPVPPSTLADIGPAPPVALIDATGKPFTLADLRGKAVIVSFVYTTCTGSCPATTFSLTRVQRALKEAGLWGKQVEFVSISLDPARDTPEVLAGYARNYQADPTAWHFLTGPPDRVAKVIAAWGMWAKTGPSGTLDHPSRIFLVDPQGRQREIYNLEFLRPASVLHDVETVLAEQAGRSPPRPLP